MNEATIAILAIFIAYTFISWGVLGPLDSISQSFYKWKDRNYSAAFNWFGASVFLACCCQSLYGWNHTTKLLFVIAGFCVWCLTVASVYKQYPLHHYVPTICSIVAGFACVSSEFGLLWKFYSAFGAFGAVAIVLVALNVKYKLTFIELWAMVCILFWFL